MFWIFPRVTVPPLAQAEGSREMFQLIGTAYEILKDEDERTNYDYMLDNPGKWRGNYDSP